MTTAPAFPSPVQAELELLDRAREIARNGRGRVSPNPLVGALVVRDGAVIGEGWHDGPGTDHAEVMALAHAGDAARGATVVCTLEPCSHHGRTPPCTDALLAAGVSRVVVGSLDPLERGRARGASTLAAAGVHVAVATGETAAGCRELISPFLTWALTGRPEVTLKMATSLDGKVATERGETRWITGARARALVHRMRADADAVAIGIGTALADDPDLTARKVTGPVRQPTRVVFDAGARLPSDGRLMSSATASQVVVVAGLGGRARPRRRPATRRGGRDRPSRGARPRGSRPRSTSSAHARPSPCSSRAGPRWPRRCSARVWWIESSGSWPRS